MTFKLQSFSTSSAFDPHIVDEVRYVSTPNGDNFNKVRSTGPVFPFNYDTRIYFFGVKWDTQETNVNSVSFPLRNLSVGFDGIMGELAFYTRDGSTVTRITDSNVNFTLTGSNTDSDYIIINFENITLPACVNTTNIIPVYIAIKLVSIQEGNNIITNAQFVETIQGQNPLYTGWYLPAESADSLQESYGILQINTLNTVPELYVE